MFLTYKLTPWFLLSCSILAASWFLLNSSSLSLLFCARLTNSFLPLKSVSFNSSTAFLASSWFS